MPIKNVKLTQRIGETKPSSLPSMYNSSLFARQHPSKEGSQYAKSELVPDEQLEDLEPSKDDFLTATKKAKEIVQTYTNKPDTTGNLEGKFSIPLEEMISKLNDLLNAEYSQWFRYYHYALVLRGCFRDALSNEFLAHADEELEHAERIGMRVIGLGGYPETKIEQPEKLQKTDEILAELIKREQEGVNLYKQVLSVCGENEGTKQLLESNIEVEQHHIDELWRFYQNPDAAMNKTITSAGRETFPSEKQAKREYSHSFARYPRGIGGSSTPDLPEVGRDWHKEESGDEEEQKEAESYFKSPKKSIDKSIVKSTQGEALDLLKGVSAISHRFIMPPKEREFLLSKGFTVEEIEQRVVKMTPILRSEFSEWISKRIMKSLSNLE